MDKSFTDLMKEYDQLKQNLIDSAIVNDPNKLKEISRRYSVLEPIAKKIERLQFLEKSINESKEIISLGEDEDLIAVASQELSDYQSESENLAKEIKEEVKPKNNLNQKSIIMEIRAGAGGDESTLFGAELFRMYTRFAETQGWKTKIISSNRTGLGGFKEIIFEVNGIGAYGWLKYESGTHRVQRVPETEKAGRVHTSTATVAVMPQADEVDQKINPGDLKIDVYRAGGHGGQSVNTTDSAVRITHLPTGLVVTCQDERSQLQNKLKAMQIIRSRLLAAQEEKRRQEISAKRKNQIGTGDRSEKIKTYNFPQDRLTDHRIKQNWHNLPGIMDGDILNIIKEVKEADEKNS